MSNSADGQRAITILVAALGGEGGGVLCEWLVDAARRAGYPVQGTSIPGVAQRTGATTYYVEIFPVPLALLGERRPILGLAPVPGAVDLLIASEPLEAARLAQAGLIDRARTIVICSNERALTNAEKMAQGDGRRELEQLEAAVRAQAREHLVLPMQTLARSGKTLISAVMLGAIAASGVLPFARSFCEEAIGSAGRGAAASRAGFALGEAAVGTRGSITPVPTSGGAGPVSRPPLPQWCRDLVGGFPGSLREVLDAGLALVADYQGRAYVELYLARLVRVLHLERTLDTLGSHDFGLTRETARFLALWMCFEDVPRGGPEVAARALCTHARGGRCVARRDGARLGLLQAASRGDAESVAGGLAEEARSAAAPRARQGSTGRGTRHHPEERHPVWPAGAAHAGGAGDTSALQRTLRP